MSATFPPHAKTAGLTHASLSPLTLCRGLASLHGPLHRHLLEPVPWAFILLDWQC